MAWFKNLKEWWRYTGDLVISWCVLIVIVLVLVGGTASLFFGLGWLWNVTVITLFIGGLMIFYQALCGYADPNYRTSKFQDAVGKTGGWLMGFAAVMIVLYILKWCFL